MKLIDHINDSRLYDIIRIDNYSKLIDILVSTNKDFHRIAVSEDYLETNDICDIFSKYRDSVLLISCGDIDFPPPKKPYSYTKYFNESLLPKNYKEINYYLKVHTDILPIIEKNTNIIYFDELSNIIDFLDNMKKEIENFLITDELSHNYFKIIL